VVKELTLSEFLKLLYPSISEGKKPTDFTVNLIDNITNYPNDNNDKDKNPLYELGENTIQKIYNGDRLLSKKMQVISIRI